MAWRFRKSKRLPLGFRLNFSRRGIGYSWGIRGFRVGRDAQGRVVRTVSIPGTGIYRRDYLTPKSPQAAAVGSQPAVKSSSGFAVAAAVVIILALVASGNLVGVILGVALAAYVLFRTVSGSRISQGQDALLAPPPGQPQLGIQVKALFDELAVSLKVTLLERRVASAYGDIFENAFLNVICRFAALDGFVKVEEGLVFQSVFSQLHPKGFGGVTGQGAVTLIEGHVQRNPSCVHDPVQSPLLVQIAQESDATRGTHCAEKLSALLYETARQVAIADGPLTAEEQRELVAFHDALWCPPAIKSNDVVAPESWKADVVNNENNPAPQPQSLQSGAAPVIGNEGQLKVPEVKSSMPGAEGDRNHPSCARFDALASAIKPFVDEMVPPVKAELRKLRMAGAAREMLEHDILRVIIQFGFDNSRVSENAGSLYLALFRPLHPRQYAAWNTANSINLLQNLAQNDPKTYLGPVEKPFTLKLLADSGAANGAELVTKAAAFFQQVAECAVMTQNGVVSKPAMLTSFKSLLQGR